MLAFLCVALLSLAVAQDVTTDAINDKLNSIETKPSVRLDPYIRKALLKALSELEENENLTTAADEDTSTVDTEILKTGEDISGNQPGKEGIQIHSFVVNGQSAFANITNTTPMFIDKKISILSTTTGNVENHVTATLPTMIPINDILQTKESNFQHVRSIQSTFKNNDNDGFKNIEKPKTSTTTTTTTSTTTTTTTPKPTHNKDGENIEDVDKRDVQVFQAPLVAAFTVHQDARGLPKKVVPIFQQANIPSTLRPSTVNLATGVLPPPVRQNLPNINSINQNAQIDILTQQLRALEEELYALQLQQLKQKQLLKEQQILLQRKEAQRQQQLLFEQEQIKKQQLIAEQQRLQTTQAINNFQLQNLQNQNTQTLNQHNNVLNQQNQALNQHVGRPLNAQVTIQPSVALDQTNSINNQQLPNREAVDFLLHLRTQQSEQFPLQENHLPQGISNFLQPNPIQSFHQSNFNQLKHGNRVFRQENGVGNFGANNNQNFNRFNQFNQQNRFFPVSRPNQFVPEAELKQLLAQSQINGRSHEDLNIVSKVLSLNHGIPINNNIYNRLPLDNRRPVRTL